jgi:hypothetical protein
MQGVRWLQLKQHLLDRGWTWRGDALYAPHETMWFQTSTAHPDLALFRNRMSIAVETTSAYVEQSVDQAELHADLVSLVAALDDVLES